MRAKRLNSKPNIIGCNVKKYRLKNGYTQNELCQKINSLGLSLYLSDIYLIENYKRIVRDYEALAISKVFGISLDELYKGGEKEFNQSKDVAFKN